MMSPRFQVVVLDGAVDEDPVAGLDGWLHRCRRRRRRRTGTGTRGPRLHRGPPWEDGQGAPWPRATLRRSVLAFRDASAVWWVSSRVAAVIMSRVCVLAQACPEVYAYRTSPGESEVLLVLVTKWSRADHRPGVCARVPEDVPVSPRREDHRGRLRARPAVRNLHHAHLPRTTAACGAGPASERAGLDLATFQDHPYQPRSSTPGPSWRMPRPAPRASTSRRTS